MWANKKLLSISCSLCVRTKILLGRRCSQIWGFHLEHRSVLGYWGRETEDSNSPTNNKRKTGNNEAGPCRIGRRLRARRTQTGKKQKNTETKGGKEDKKRH